MELEILFRGKRLDNGEWVEGWLLAFKAGQINEGRCFILPFVSSVRVELGTYSFGEFVEVDPETVGQYTGLTDKHGKKIFEGDFIKVSTFEFDAETFVTEVVFEDRLGMRGFCLKNGRSLFYYGQKDFSKMDDAKVIGNRWDNPELLEVER